MLLKFQNNNIYFQKTWNFCYMADGNVEILKTDLEKVQYRGTFTNENFHKFAFVTRPFCDTHT